MMLFRGRLFKQLVARAEVARARQQFILAAALFEEALHVRPDRTRLHVQCGHMLKEGGRLAAAEVHYREAQRLRPNDADLAVQLGHFYKVSGRLESARQEYARALLLRPGWDVPTQELDVLARHVARSLPRAVDMQDRPRDVVAAERDRRWTIDEIARLVPALAPRMGEEPLREDDDHIAIHRPGRAEDGPWGVRRTVRGIEAVHGHLFSTVPLEMRVLLNERELFRGPLRGGYPLPADATARGLQKYVFNEWIDFSEFAPGLHALELRFLDAAGPTRSWHDSVVIAAPVPEDDYPGSDFLIAPCPADPRPLDLQIRSRPSQVHQAARMLFPDGVHNVLVLRTDQLGDMVASIGAVRRLRALLPGARLVGLLTAANAQLALSVTGLFDEVIVIDFPDIASERRRVMPLDRQEALRRKLEPYHFDIAIDLARAGVSRELLRLSGAKFLYGTGGGNWPFLSGEFLFNTHDRWTGHDTTPHSTKVLALVETLGAIVDGRTAIIRRTDLAPDMLAPMGIDADERYVVLHLGARIGFSRWPHYTRLAHMLLEKTDLKIVVIGGDAADHDDLAQYPAEDQRLLVLAGELPFDRFDALLSFATVMVGNDSGPKHLASLRGTPVVTIFSARINWTEWGQENVGVIISRKVPCAGCTIFHEPENCGKDFACVVDIQPEEVFAQVMRLAERSSGEPS